MKKIIPNLLLAIVLSLPAAASDTSVEIDVSVGETNPQEQICIETKCEWGRKRITIIFFTIEIPWLTCQPVENPSCKEPGDDKPGEEQPPEKKPGDDKPPGEEQPPEKNPGEDKPGDEDTSQAQFTAEDLKGYLEIRELTQGWKQIGPPNGGKFKSEGHGGICAKVSVNEKAQSLYPEDGNAAERVFDKDSVIVKADHSPGKNGNALVAMKKVSRETGDWIFAEVKIEGQTATITNQGKIETCVACHQKFQDFDLAPTVDMWKNLKNNIKEGNVFKPCDAATEPTDPKTDQPDPKTKDSPDGEG